MQKTLPEIFAKAMALPTAHYLRPDQRLTNCTNTVLVRMEAKAKTNARSRFPIVGTLGFDPCTAIALYNPGQQLTNILHEPGHPCQKTRLGELLAEIRGDRSELVFAHMLGASFDNPQFSLDGDPETLSPDDANERDVIDYFIPLLEMLRAAGNIELKTFDIGNKPKPDAVAIDARDGALIRGSRLYTSALENFKNHNHQFDDRSIAPENEDFDGTLPEFAL